MAAPTTGGTGFDPVRYLNGALWNGELMSFPIQSGYANNISKGDPVIVGKPDTINPGYCLNLADFAKGTFPTPAPASQAAAPIFGVFIGCSYQTAPALNPMDPASPARIFWPTGTVTLDSADATAFICVDPQVVYRAKTNALVNVLTGAARLKYASAAVPTTGGIADVSSSGTSVAYVDTGAIAFVPTALNVRILGLSDYPNNAWSNLNPYVDVIFENIYFGGRSAA